MKTHTTNYFDTFIEIAEDSPAGSAKIPPVKGERKTVANLQFEMLYDNPYRFSSDEILFSVFAIRNAIPKTGLKDAREEFFSKGQACFRASPLTKQYGWGVHCNHEGKIAIYGAGSKEYKAFVNDKSVKKVKAMRSAKK